jgi:hypothetical protein
MAFAGVAWMTGRSSVAAQSGTRTPSADRAGLMQHHFALATAVHDAVIRGDLQTARAQARALADAPAPADLPASAGPFLERMQNAARRGAGSTTLQEIAWSASAMLGACGGCHRAVGTMPAVASAPVRNVGGTVGHMVAHKAAVDQLVEGLIIPSTTAWNAGADALRTAPLRRKELPADPKLTKEILAGEGQIHALAERARQATEPHVRVELYGEIIQNCSSCHALHANVWGPNKK